MRFVFFSLLIFCCFTFKLKATHGLPIVNLSYTISSTGITVSGESDLATCGSGPYWMQVEVTSTGSLTGTPPATLQTTLATGAGGATVFNNYPWYNSLLNIPSMNAANGWSDACVTGEHYNDVFIPFSDLVCGNVYYFGVREWVGGSNSSGPWSTPISFTVPGIPGSDISFSLSTMNDTICSYDSTSLFPINIVNGPITNYSWSSGVGTTSTVMVSPNVTTTFSLTASNTEGCYHMDTVTIYVKPILNPSFTPANPIICSGDNIIFNAVGSASLASHYWDFNPNTGFTINNSTVTPTPDVNFNTAGNYVVTHTVSSMGCSYTATTNVMVNVCTGVNEVVENSISVYPNPSVNGVFNIAYPAYLKGKLNIEVYDVIGKLILSKENYTENEIQLAKTPGIYFLKIFNEKQIRSLKKIIIE
jgi:hypothetical protein